MTYKVWLVKLKLSSSSRYSSSRSGSERDIGLYLDIFFSYGHSSGVVIVKLLITVSVSTLSCVHLLIFCYVCSIIVGYVQCVYTYISKNFY